MKKVFFVLSILIILPFFVFSQVNYTSSAMYDDDGNGRVDRIRVNLDGAINGFSNSTGWTVSNIPGGGTVSNPIAGTNPNTFVDITINEGNIDTSRDTLTIQYSGGGAAFIFAFGPVSPTDLARPVIYTAVYTDSIVDGRVDRVTITFSERLLGTSSYNDADWSVDVGGDINLQDDTAASDPASSTSITLSMSGDINETGCPATEPDIRYTNNANRISDTAGNAMVTATNYTLTDGAAPYIASAVYEDNVVDGQIDRVVITFTETLSFGSFYDDADWSVDVSGNINLQDDTAGTSPSSSTTLTLTMLGDVNETGCAVTQPDIRYTNNASRISDGTNDMATITNFTLTDGAAPYLSSAVYQDNVVDGQIDRVLVTFTEALSVGSSYADADWGVAVAGDITLQDDTAGSNPASSTTLTLTMQGDANETSCPATQPVISYTNNANRIADSSGNNMASIANVTLGDGAAPYILSALYEDNVVNGQIDRVVITFTETLSAGSSYADADWGVAVAGDITLLDDTAGSNPASTTTLTLTMSADANETGCPATQPDISYTNIANRISDGANNTASIASFTLTDNAAPYIASAVYQDNVVDGQVDRVLVTFTETLSVGSSYADADWGVAVAGDITLLDDTAGSNPASSTTLALTMQGDANETSCPVTQPDISYTNNANRIADSSGNNMASIANVTLGDGAAPYILSALYEDNVVNGQIDRVVITFTETLSAGSSYADADWGVAVAGDITLLDDTAGSNPASTTTLTLTMSADANETGCPATQPDISYTNNANRIADSSGNNMASIANVTLGDGAAPYILSALYEDSDANGQIDQVVITFTETLSAGSSYADADWGVAVAGDITLLDDTAGTNPASSTTLTLTMAGDADETGVGLAGTEPAISYTNNANRISDGTNNTASIGSFTLTDNSAPIVLSAVRTIEASVNNTYELSFSEPIQWGSMIIGFWAVTNNDLDLSDGGGTGGGLYDAPTQFGLYGIGGHNITSGAQLNSPSPALNTYYIAGGRKSIKIRFGGVGLIRTNGIENTNADFFVPDANLKDDADLSVLTRGGVAGGKQAGYNLTAGAIWYVTSPNFNTAATNERAGQINGEIDNLQITFDITVDIDDVELGFGASTVNGYTVTNDDHTNANTTSLSLNLNESGGGDTDITPLITYHNAQDFNIVSYYGKVEMDENENITPSDGANPVIVAVEFDKDDPGAFTDESPYYDDLTGLPQDPGVGPWDFDMHSGTGSTTVAFTSRTYHNTVKFEFSEPITFNPAIPTDTQAGGYDFLASQQSSATIGDLSDNGNNTDISGLGSLIGGAENFNIALSSAGNNFMQLEDSENLYLHVAGWWNGTNFPSQISNTGSVEVPNSADANADIFETIANANITDNTGGSLPLVARDTGGANPDQMTITFVSDWDVAKPVFRFIPATAGYKGDPDSGGASNLSDGSSAGSPLINRVEFAMSEAILDEPAGQNYANLFNIIFEDDASPTSNTSFATTTSGLIGDVINDYNDVPQNDNNVNDQGISITFDTVAGKGTNTQVIWTYTGGSGGSYITDLRGNRVGDLGAQTSLENAPPYVRDTRSVPGTNLMYVEFNERVMRDGAGSIPIPADFTYDSTVSGSGLSITNISSLDAANSKFLFTLSANLTKEYIVNDLIYTANATAVRDSMRNYVDNGVQYPASTIGINFFESVAMQDFVHKGSGWRISTFDGSKEINAENMIVIANVYIPKFAGLTPTLYYDVLRTHNASKFWLPSQNNDARSVSGVSKGNNDWEFLIPSSDSEIKSGSELSFVFKIGNYYCYRSPVSITDPSFSPDGAETHMVKLRRILFQNNSVTILNNVIDPRKGETTKMIYQLEKAGPVSIVVYDLKSDVVKVLKQTTDASGTHVVTWDGRNNNGKIVTRGVYFIRVRAPGIFNQLRKVLVIK